MACTYSCSKLVILLAAWEVVAWNECHISMQASLEQQTRSIYYLALNLQIGNSNTSIHIRGFEKILVLKSLICSSTTIMGGLFKYFRQIMGNTFYLFSPDNLLFVLQVLQVIFFFKLQCKMWVPACGFE